MCQQHHIIFHIVTQRNIMKQIRIQYYFFVLSGSNT
jgi:hypothetical protein